MRRVVRPLTAAVSQLKNKVSHADAVVYLLELQLDGSTALRVARYDVPITYQGKTWSPLHFDVSNVRSASDGRIDDATVTVSNVRRYFVHYYDAAAIAGRRVRLIVLPVAEAADDDAGLETLFTVNLYEATETDLVLRIGTANPLSQPVPSERFARTHCRFLKEYGSANSRCGYDATLSGALTTCDGTLEGSNGCRAHGLNELSRGLPSLHPLRFGGFPGIGEGPIDV